jgi:multidrug efflux pump subunit AcrA (membrane-fusion protein)
VDVRVPSLNRTFDGKVARFSVDVRTDTRTMHTEVDVHNRDHVLVPGLYAEADLTLEHKEDIPAIPLQALNHEGDKTTVFVVNGNDVLEDRTVRLGIQTANDAEVVDGLREGEMAVVSDRAGLKIGEKVSPQIVQVMQYHESNSE